MHVRRIDAAEAEAAVLDADAQGSRRILATEGTNKA